MFLGYSPETTGQIIGINPEEILVETYHGDIDRDAGNIGSAGFILTGEKSGTEEQEKNRFFHSDFERLIFKNVVTRM
jgi:hypothetical protein